MRGCSSATSCPGQGAAKRNQLSYQAGGAIQWNNASADLERGHELRAATNPAGNLREATFHLNR